ncbi:MAG: NADH-ubiquinone oxidoreductase-F iron-sulfur binding region domain-containing protein [Eubacteriales bacterium]|nr:NADH-ubiquinone oxidoreductase-F iron-sulfur binding region domain-containing protein [Eubacteriales bacterium]
MKTIRICCGTGCLANGATLVACEFEKQLSGSKDAKLECVIKKTGCNGFCENGPLVTIVPDDIAYYHVKPKDVIEIIDKTIKNGELVERLLYKDNEGKPVKTKEENPFYKPQKKIALRNIGIIDLESIDDYLENGGYEALKKTLNMTQDDIIKEVEESGLRGRGGAGFPTGRKWRTAQGYDVFPKYVVCNGDEGDPGAFMDRSILEGDPHSVLEGLAICAIAIGAEKGYLYIRDEYNLALKHIKKAIVDAEKKGYLGDNILGSGKKLKLEVVRGGGAFVCGESTALMKSIEGKVGEPRAKYIRSVQKGLWDHPTVLNNVETLANIPYIFLHSAKEFASIGTKASAGTKVFALVGKVKRTGLVEVPMGTTLRELIFDIGGGVIGDREFKAVQTGGPSGGCIGKELLDSPLDFEELKLKGSMMGSGGVIVMDDTSCMVEVARYYVEFLCGESCGKCTPCREGLRRMLEILTDICNGKGTMEDLDILMLLAETMGDASLCALGKSAMNPVVSTLKLFRDEYEAHIKEHYCPAGVCEKLTEFYIDKDTCKGCSACSKVCPVGAITGEIKKVYTIDRKKCIACGSCRNTCKFDSVHTRGKEGCDAKN